MKRICSLLLTLVAVLAVNAQSDVVEIKGDKASYISYTKSSNDWYMELTGSNGDCFYLDYRSKDFAGEFTLDDCDTDYTFYRSGSNDYDHMTSLEVTVTGLSTAGYTIKGTAIGESGTKYIIDIDNPDPLQPIRTVDVDGDVSQATILDDGVTTFTVKPTSGEDIVYQIAISGLVGSFGRDDIVKKSTFRQDMTSGEVVQYDNGTVEITLGENYTINALADLVMSDSVEYRINFTYPLPVKDQKDITVTNIKVDGSSFDWFGVYYIQGYNDDYTIKATCQPESFEVIDQEFTSSEISFTVTDNATNKSISSAILENATQTIDENGIPSIKATFIGDDLVKYVVDMSYVMPDEKGVKEYSFENLEFSNFLSSGGFQIMGYNADNTQYASLAIYSEQVEGNYTIENSTIDSDYSVFCYVTPEGYRTVNFLKGNATVTMDADGAILVKTHLFGDDGYWYNLTITSQFKKAYKDSDCEDKDIEATFTKEDCFWLTYDEEGSCGRIRLRNDEHQDMFDMLVYCDKDAVTTIPAGTYDVNDTGENPSVQPGELYYTLVYPSFYATLNDEGYVNTPLWFLCEGTVTVYNNDGELAFEVDGKNSYGRTIHVTYNMESTGIEDLIQTLSQGDGATYNVAGQNVNENYKGIVIRNGKKILK